MRQGAALIRGRICGDSSLEPVTGAALALMMQLWVKRAEIIISIFVFPVELLLVFESLFFVKHLSFL